MKHRTSIAANTIAADVFAQQHLHSLCFAENLTLKRTTVALGLGEKSRLYSIQ